MLPRIDIIATFHTWYVSVSTDSRILSRPMHTTTHFLSRNEAMPRFGIIYLHRHYSAPFVCMVNGGDK